MEGGSSAADGSFLQSRSPGFRQFVVPWLEVLKRKIRYGKSRAEGSKGAGYETPVLIQGVLQVRC